eukprot:8203532-Pyramimonas_sp.AAC.1
MARVGWVVQSPDVQRHVPVIVRKILICSNERIYDGIGVASSCSQSMTGAMVTANVLSQHRRPREPRAFLEVLQAQ